MDKTIKLTCCGLNLREDCTASYTVSLSSAVNKLVMASGRFTLTIIFTDLVDIDDFLNFVKRESRKAVLLCSMEMEGKSYSGKRKLRWSGGNISVSLGGVRIDFPEESVAQLAVIGQFIRDSHLKH